uniref:C-type lectin domain-containing protein n=1 Tax=Panagrolaimus sp. JU765 TaxID=591449 RepID=A0AC34RR04_9BILA
MFISTLVYETVENFKYYWIGGTMRTVMMNGGKSVDYANSPMVWNAAYSTDAIYSHLCKKPSYLHQKNFSRNANSDMQCPPGAVLFYDNKTCYLVVKDPMSFADAEDVCNKQGGNLAMVRSPPENMFIISLVYEALGNFKYYWIGGIPRTVMMNGGKSVDVWSWTKDSASFFAIKIGKKKFLIHGLV